MGLNSILLCKTLILFSWLTCSMAQPKRIVCVYDPFDEGSGPNGNKRHISKHTQISSK